ncbi:TetR/AcrR family transcriptional regulator [Desulfococcus sp.]|uniref:TetR/AcrR family transcriptional regulator n=1 Tax=Desulfococcus sp. TaxID=2025834 RepID=UPI00359449B8
MGIQERKKRERAQRRQQILAAAKKMVSTKGFRSTTIDDIAREAEVSTTTIYLYFQNKEELLVSLTFNSLQYLDLRLGEVFSSHGKSDLNSKISALHHVLSDAYQFNPFIFENMFHLLAAENLDCMTPTLRGQVQNRFNSIIENLTAIFAYTGKDAGSALKTGEVVNLFFTLLSGVSIWSGISDQLSGDKINGGCSEKCDAMMGLFRHTVNFLQAGLTKELQPIER